MELRIYVSFLENDHLIFGELLKIEKLILSLTDRQPLRKSNKKDLSKIFTRFKIFDGRTHIKKILFDRSIYYIALQEGELYIPWENFLKRLREMGNFFKDTSRKEFLEMLLKLL